MQTVEEKQNADPASIPLAERMRPRRLQDYVGQTHLIAPGAPVRVAIEKGNVPSMIFWGPPGVGKTTLADLISAENGICFMLLSDF
jgi:putative ATPase